jgi:hypothetical protein
MEYWVYIHRGGKLELVSIFAYLFDDREGAMAFVVELSCGAVGLKVLHIQPYQVSGEVCRGGESVLVGVFLLVVLGEGHLVLSEVVDFVQVVGQAAGLSFFGVVNADVRFEVELRVETVIGEEGGKAGRLGGVVIGGEFGYGEELGPVVLLVVYVYP